MQPPARRIRSPAAGPSDNIMASRIRLPGIAPDSRRRARRGRLSAGSGRSRRDEGTSGGARRGPVLDAPTPESGPLRIVHRGLVHWGGWPPQAPHAPPRLACALLLAFCSGGPACARLRARSAPRPRVRAAGGGLGGRPCPPAAGGLPPRCAALRAPSLRPLGRRAGSVLASARVPRAWSPPLGGSLLRPRPETARFGP